MYSKTKLFIIFITLLVTSLIADELNPFTVEVVEPGRTRLKWWYQNGVGQGWQVKKNFYDIYASQDPNEVTNINTLLNGNPILLVKGQHWSKQWFDHVLGNYPQSSHQGPAAYYYAIIIRSIVDGENIFYDDDYKGYLQGVGDYCHTEDISTTGFASSSCLSNYVSSPGWGVWQVFFNPATDMVEIGDYANGSLTFWVRDEAGTWVGGNYKIALNSSEGTVYPPLPLINSWVDNTALTAGKWALVQIPMTNFYTNGSLPEKALSIQIDQAAPIPLYFLFDRAGFNKTIVPGATSYELYTNTTIPVVNSAVMKEAVVAAFGETVSPAYYWLSGGAGEFFRWPTDETDVLSVPAEFSWDGNGAIGFSYQVNSDGYGGIGMPPNNISLLGWDEMRFMVKGQYLENNLGPLDNTVIDPNLAHANAKLFNLELDGKAIPIPVMGTGDWEEVKVPLTREVTGGNPNMGWFKISFNAPCKGTFFLDNVRLVRYNIWDPIEIDTTPYILRDWYPKSADIQYLIEREDPNFQVVPKLAFNKMAGNNAGIIHRIIHEDGSMDPWQTNITRDGTKDGNIYIYNKAGLPLDTFKSGKTVLFKVPKEHADVYGNQLAEDFYWSVSTDKIPLQYVKLSGKIMVPGSIDYLTAKILTASGDFDTIRAYLLNRDGIPVRNLEAIDDPDSPDPREMIIEITPYEKAGTTKNSRRLPAGIYYLYIEEDYDPALYPDDDQEVRADRKVVKKTVYIQ